jgi:transposase
MSKKLFTEQEIDLLNQNKYVKRVGTRGITYTDEMKQYAISLNEKGMFSTEIFEKAGFDLSVIGRIRAQKSLDRWTKSYKEQGVSGLQDSRKGKSGRPLERELSLEEQLQRKDAKIKLLEVQLELQKKLDMIERGVYINKHTKIKK